MKEDQDEFFEQPDVEQLHDIKPIEQANPIYDKSLSEQPKSVPLKMIQIPKEPPSYTYRAFSISKRQQESGDEEEVDYDYESPFLQYYSIEQLIFKKYNNTAVRKINNRNYFSGSFIHKNVFADNSIVLVITGANGQMNSSLPDIVKSYYDAQEQSTYRSKTDPVFNSNFESANLFAVFKISAFQYDLVMSNDVNSTGNNQWFYFSVEKLIATKQYTFNVVNFTKNDSLFNYGMAPCVYSVVQNNGKVDNQKGWRRTGKDVSYKKGAINRQYSNRMYYKLTFKLTTKFQKDKLYIAHSYPYSFEKLNKFIAQKITKTKQLVSKITIGKTLSKRAIEGLKICLPINKKRDTRKAVIIMARQHPGETQGSFVCEGVVEKLLSKGKQTEYLVKNYVFYVIPMVNVDGVVFGHYRTNLSGKDLNRKWNATQKQTSCPEVTSIKSFLQQVSKERDIRFIIDLHGHSKKLNSFFYGNPCPDNPDVVRIFPYVCSKLSPAVQFYDCTFSSEESKRKAARIYLSFLYRLVHVYTFQSSFYAYFKDGKKIEFNPKEYRDLGGTLVQALFLQLEHEIKFQQSFEFNLSKNKQYQSSNFVKMLTELKTNKQLMQTGLTNDSGSDSKPEEGQLPGEDLGIPPVKKRPQSTKFQESKSAKTSRKGPRQRQYNFNKPIRNIKFLEISRVNSVLPDKYQLGLQPIKKKEQIKPSSKGVIRINGDSQTEIKGQGIRYADFKNNEIEETNLSGCIKMDANNQKRFSSVIKTNNRNIIFKLDFFNQPSREQTPKQKIFTMKNAYSQTMITYSRESGEKIRSSQLFPHVQSPDKEEKKWLRNNSIRVGESMRGGLRREAEMFFNGMVKKFLNQKDYKTEHMSNIRIMEKPLSIKKKEINRK